MDKTMIPVVIFIGEYIIHGMINHYAGASLDSYLERDRDDFLEIKNARIFLAATARELYTIGLLEVNKQRVTMIFSEDSIISRGE